MGAGVANKGCHLIAHRTADGWKFSPELVFGVALDPTTGTAEWFGASGFVTVTAPQYEVATFADPIDADDEAAIRKWNRRFNRITDAAANPRAPGQPVPDSFIAACWGALGAAGMAKVQSLGERCTGSTPCPPYFFEELYDATHAQYVRRSVLS